MRHGIGLAWGRYHLGVRRVPKALGIVNARVEGRVAGFGGRDIVTPYVLVHPCLRLRCYFLQNQVANIGSLAAFRLQDALCIARVVLFALVKFVDVSGVVVHGGGCGRDC